MTEKRPGKNLVVLFGDQLTVSIASLRQQSKNDCIVLMAEVMAEATAVRHHKKKLAFVFSAMRHFARELEAAGWAVDYVELEDAENSQSFEGEISRAVARHRSQQVVVTEPSEWRVKEVMNDLASQLPAELTMLPDDRFLASHAEFAAWAKDRKQLRMEFFYRDMRRKTGLLMDGDQPVGGRWNFDAENRKPAELDLFIPSPLRFEPDDITQQVLQLVARRFDGHFGDLEPFWWGVTSDQAHAALEHFLANSLPHFGDYQDAMLEDEDFLYHSVLSHYINIGLLDPLEVCNRVAGEYTAGRAPLNAVEGYIRQIIGWREFVRGLYWLHMPDYLDRNDLAATRDLPDFYWTGKTDMACMAAAIDQTRRQAYAHHIQRLMVTGNFALLVGVEPKQVHQWYLEVYADAYEWVELPNTFGMSQFADGGLLASKPYAASGNYINKMSNHCKSCRYDVKQKTGDAACPFNSLYWDFLVRNETGLGNNARLRQAYSTWGRMAHEKQSAYLSSAAKFLDTLTP